MEIKVLGPGCPRCQTLEKNAKDAVAELGLDARIEKVTDINEIANCGVFMTPGPGCRWRSEARRQGGQQR